MKNSNAALEIDSPEADPLEPRPLDLSKAARGKYFDKMQEGTNIILLAPDIMDTFPDSDSVNEALRSLKAIATRATHRA
jgi:hypothetical protein